MVGWNCDCDESGFYFFDFKIGVCIDIFKFNNGVVFLFDGNKFFNILLIENGWIDVVEYEIVMGEVI